eukprot:649006-Hanusia_phi.AAC.2
MVCTEAPSGLITDIRSSQIERFSALFVSSKVGVGRYMIKAEARSWRQKRSCHNNVRSSFKFENRLSAYEGVTEQ